MHGMLTPVCIHLRIQTGNRAHSRTSGISSACQAIKPMSSPASVPHSKRAAPKWFLWHGNVFRSLHTVDDITTDLEDQDTGGQQDKDRHDKLAKAVREFAGYLAANAPAIPNYGERYRAGEIISTSFVESAVNQVISKRMVKKQQMRWSPQARTSYCRSAPASSTTPSTTPSPTTTGAGTPTSTTPPRAGPSRVASHGLSRSRIHRPGRQ